VGVAEQARGRVTDLLGQLVGRGIAALAQGIVAPPALVALAAGDGERHHDAVADLELAVGAADLDHLAHGLVAHHVARLHVRHEAAGEMEIRPADRAGRDLDDGVAPVLDRRIRDLLATNVIPAVPAQSPHEVRSREKVIHANVARSFTVAAGA